MFLVVHNTWRTATYTKYMFLYTCIQKRYLFPYRTFTNTVYNFDNIILLADLRSWSQWPWPWNSWIYNWKTVFIDIPQNISPSLSSRVKLNSFPTTPFSYTVYNFDNIVLLAGLRSWSSPNESMTLAFASDRLTSSRIINVLTSCSIFTSGYLAPTV